MWKTPFALAKNIIHCRVYAQSKRGNYKPYAPTSRTATGTKEEFLYNSVAP